MALNFKNEAQFQAWLKQHSQLRDISELRGISERDKSETKTTSLKSSVKTRPKTKRYLVLSTFWYRTIVISLVSFMLGLLFL